MTAFVSHRCDDPQSLQDLYERSREEGFGAEVKRRILTGTYTLSVGYFDAYYLKAQKIRRLISEDFQRALPTLMCYSHPLHQPGFQKNQLTDDHVAMYQQDLYTVPTSLAGLPAISLPCGFRMACPWACSLSHLPLAKSCSFSWPPNIRVKPTGICRATGGFSMKWEAVIGLEIHVQLATKSKIFSGASTAYGASPNAQACNIDLGLPGVLPVLNEKAVEMAVRFGLAIGAQINRYSIFDRKNYFYADLPKGYQISQFETPVVGEGTITIAPENGKPRRWYNSRALRRRCWEICPRPISWNDCHRPQSHRHAFTGNCF